MIPKPFIHDDFLLDSQTARHIYHRFAEPQPLIDYHCHLNAAEIASDRRWENITQLWLGEDHYKWRAMRAAGVAEEFCTGKASDQEKFQKFAWVVPQTLRNPLYHWCHLELARGFGITTLLSPETADEIYEECSRVMTTPEFSVCGLLRKFQVRAVCTTDDPVDSLEHHCAIAKNPEISTLVLPTWRPDKAWMVDRPTSFLPWVERLEDVTGGRIGSFVSYLAALKTRHDFFADHGCLLSDRGMETIPVEECSQEQASVIFESARSGQAISAEEARSFQSFMLHELARWDGEKKWTMQIHCGPLRNTNTRAFHELGPDTGFDSISDLLVANGLSRHLDRLDSEGLLPKTILYNLNPRENEVYAAMAGNFQDGITPGKIQFGAAWWFLDQLDGMTRQIETLSQIGLLSCFVGMLTDSRSFLSFTRHEYFRRLLCNILGADIDRGRIPNDDTLVGAMIEKICYQNGRSYFGFPIRD
jgi:glucuronate isomerase